MLFQFDIQGNECSVLLVVVSIMCCYVRYHKLISRSWQIEQPQGAIFIGFCKSFEGRPSSSQIGQSELAKSIRK